MLLFEDEEGACCESGIRGGRGGRYSGRSIGARLVAVRVVRGVNPVVVANSVGFDRVTKSSPAEEWVFRNILCLVVSAVCDMDKRLVDECVSSKGPVMSTPRWVDFSDCDRRVGDRNVEVFRVLVGESLPLPLPSSSYFPLLLLLPK